ncbi:MAG TPA: TonB-dependent receptor [Sphingomicrobium sp.]|nr:TonB-dependent receptor [Sphingomicrobium sp.]
MNLGIFATPAAAQDVATPEQPQTDGPPTDVTTPTGPVEGQPLPSTSAEGEGVDEAQDVIVTGSRIPQPNLESASPVTVVSDQDVKLSGVTRIEDLLNQLPSVGASQNATQANGATGTAEVDLRALGSQRTLVLVNGRRLVPGDPNSTTQAPDINFIPAALIKRVDVLTGGASSVYGADAVAGVVNFIMDTRFEGLRFDGTFGIYQHRQDNPSIVDRKVRDALNERIAQGLAGYDYPTGSDFDGRQIDATVSFGAGFDDGRGHVVAYAGYRNVKPVLQSQRDFSSCGLTGAGDNITCGGSGTSAEGRFFTSVFDAFTFGPDRSVTPGSPLYNFNPTNYFQRPDKRFIGGAFAEYEINNQIKPYLEFMFMDDRTLAQIAPSGNFGNTLTINCDTPLASAEALSDVICAPGNLVTGFLGTYPSTNDAPVGNFTGTEAPLTFFDAFGNQYNQGFFNLFRRNVEGGPRVADLKHTAFRGVLGTRGDLSNAWAYDVYYQYGRTNYDQIYKNEFSIQRLTRALNVIDDPRTPGVVDPICRSVLDNTDPNCVPYDVFGTPSAASINYLNVFGVISGFTTEQVANANFTGLLGEYGLRTPWAEDGFGINVGAEYRKETLSLSPDQSFQTGDLTGQGAPTLPVDGSFTVKEVFAEAQLPIVQRSFIEDLTLGAGYRKSYYELENGREFDTDTYKLTAELAPIRDIRFRAAYNRAVRAPNIQELFAPQFVGLSGSSDPCAGITITAADFGCIAQGLAPGDFTPSNPAEQYNSLLGGNPNLTPEKATTKTLGVVLQPSFLPRFALTVDYFNINLKGAVQGFGADAILADCVNNATATVTPASCALVNRDPAGSIWLTSGGFVNDTPVNVGGIKTDGIDFNASYSHRFSALGNLSLSFVGTRLRRYITDNGLTDAYDCAGFYGAICSGGTVSSSAPLPKWRHKARATLQTPMGLGLSAQWRMMGKVAHERTSDDDSLSGAGAPPVLSRRIKAQHYLDVAATYTLWDRVNLRAGINNLLDNDPPLITSSAGSCPTGPCSGNTYPGTWDPLGRFMYLGATIDFKPRRKSPVAPAPAYIAPPPPVAPPATQTCADGSVILATDACPVLPPPPPPPPPAAERG